MKANLKSTLSEVTAPGDFCFDNADTFIFICLPHGHYCRLPITTPKEIGNSWGWDGNREQPTLTPSINMLDPYPWHGWFRAGNLIQC